MKKRADFYENIDLWCRCDWRPAMKFYESGDSRKPVIFLFPGTCCLYSSFDHVLDGLHSYFYTVTVSYDGFDPNEKTEFYSM